MQSSSTARPTSTDQDDPSERNIEKIARLVSQKPDIKTFTNGIIAVATDLLGASRVRIWLGHEPSDLTEYGDQPPCADESEMNFCTVPTTEQLAFAFNNRSISTSSELSQIDKKFDPVDPLLSHTWIIAPVISRTTVQGVLYCGWHSAQPREETNSKELLAQRIVDAIAPYFEGQVDALRSDTVQPDSVLQEFCLHVHTDPSLSTTASAVAVEFQRLVRSDRTWVLLPAGQKWKVKAVGGIPEFQRRSAVVRKLQTMVSLVAHTKKPFRWSIGMATTDLSPRLRSALEEYLDESHIVDLRIEPLANPDLKEATVNPQLQIFPVGIVVCEWFQPETSPVQQRYWTAAGHQAAIALQNAFDWSQAPLSASLRRWRRNRRWQSLAGWMTALVAAAIALTFLAMIPIEFTVDAMGEFQPIHRRHVFAKSTGIVRSLSVTTGSVVSEGTLLLELESPELEMEIRRTEGELQTTEQRIMAIEASRLNFGATSPDKASQINSLAGDLKEQMQRRDNLNRELELLSIRRNDLRVTSPIKGRVVTWDLDRLLSRRPVSRGQRLLTVSDIDGPWELEFRVNDEDTSDLYTAMKTNSAVPVDFVAVTMPERVFSTTLKSVSETLEVRSAGQPPTLLCKADLPETMDDSAVEGMTVRGRIQCGTQPAATVLFAKLSRVIRERVLFPLGW